MAKKPPRPPRSTADTGWRLGTPKSSDGSSGIRPSGKAAKRSRAGSSRSSAVRTGNGGGKKPAVKRSKQKRSAREFFKFATSRKLRFLVGGALIGGLVLFFGSIVIRYRVIELVEQRTLQSSAVVLGRTFPLHVGTDLKRMHVLSRLKRLRYQAVETVPDRAGQYRMRDDELAVYLRSTPIESRIEGQPIQSAELVTLRLKQNLIESIRLGSGRAASTVWLEPELLGQLGRTASRASTSKELNEFDPLLVKALLSIEDERFHYHFGIDPVGITRAIWSNLRAGQVVQGGSTLTQQLAKNLFTGGERTFVRKIIEAIAAVMLETAFTKDQILELYLNEVFLAQEGQVAIHGFAEAALTLFGKEVSDLSAAQAALLAGMVKAPSTYSPRRNPDRAIERRNVVLEKMLQDRLIDQTEYALARRTELSVKEPERMKRIAPYFVDYLSRLLDPAVKRQTVDIRPLSIHTGIDPEYQLCATKAVQAGLLDLGKKFPKIARGKRSVQAALVSLVPSSGEIRAWVGGKDYAHNQFDRVSLAKRQPGSAFKPFVFLTALDSSLNSYRTASTTSLLVDEPVAMKLAGAKTWEPQNYDKQFRGDVTFRQALTQSLNVPAVQLATKVGIDRVARTAELFGFGSDLPQVPALALGAGEVTPLELARAYAGLANGGSIPVLRPILSVTRDGGTDLVYSSEPAFRSVASPQATFVLTDMLRSVVESGTARIVRSLGYEGPVAGKTGTTNDARDAWFAAYTPHLLAVVWVGYDDNEPLGLTGGQAAAPIWTSYMKCIQAFEPRAEFVAPEGVLFRKVDLASGLLATEDCTSEDVVTEVFVEGTEPQLACPIHSRRDRLFGGTDDRIDFESDRPPQQQEKSSGGISDFIDNLFN